MPVDIVPRTGGVMDGGAGYNIQNAIALLNSTYSAGVDAYGNLIVMTEGTKPTYSVASIGFALPATPTQIFSMMGSATKTVRILRVSVSGFAAVASQTIMLGLQKLSTAPTGGTPVNPTIVAHDTGMNAVSSILSTNVAHYTALPTLGTGLYVRTRPTLFGLATTAAGDAAVWDFTTRNGQGMVLRGVSQGIAINLNGIALANATTLAYDVEWSEE